MRSSGVRDNNVLGLNVTVDNAVVGPVAGDPVEGGEAVEDIEDELDRAVGRQTVRNLLVKDLAQRVPCHVAGDNVGAAAARGHLHRLGDAGITPVVNGLAQEPVLGPGHTGVGGGHDLDHHAVPRSQLEVRYGVHRDGPVDVGPGFPVLADQALNLIAPVQDVGPGRE